MLGRLDAALDSLRDTLRHAARDPDPTRELAISRGVWRYWLIRGHLTEGRAILDGILERRGLVATTAGVRTARGAASLAFSVGDLERASTLSGEVLAAALQVGDPVEVVHAYNLAGAVANGREDFRAAERHYLEAIRIGEAIGQLGIAGRSVANLGESYLDQGRLAEARVRFEAVLAQRLPWGPSEGLGFAHLNLGEVELEAGDLEAAEAHYHAAATSFEAAGFRSRLANACQGLAAVEARTGRAASAARRLGIAATILGEIGSGGDAPRSRRPPSRPRGGTSATRRSSACSARGRERRRRAALGLTPAASASSRRSRARIAASSSGSAWSQPQRWSVPCVTSRRSSSAGVQRTSPV